MFDNEKVVERLNDLLAKNYDAEAGYKKAAEETKEQFLKGFFDRKAQQCYDFGHEIKAEIKALGGTPDKGTSILGDLHRAWLDVKKALSFDNKEAILEECERGEEARLEEYDEILKNTELPSSTRTVLEKQRMGISTALKTVKALED